jgi:hypothetical protein
MLISGRFLPPTQMPGCVPNGTLELVTPFPDKRGTHFSHAGAHSSAIAISWQNDVTREIPGNPSDSLGANQGMP